MEGTITSPLPVGDDVFWTSLICFMMLISFIWFVIGVPESFVAIITIFGALILGIGGVHFPWIYLGPPILVGLLLLVAVIALIIKMIQMIL